MQPLALEGEFEVAVGERLLRGFVALRLPIAAIPELNGAAAILALGDGALEIAVVERMILDLDRQALVVRVERGAAGDRPGLEDAIEFQPQVVVKPRRIMLLDDEAPPDWRRPMSRPRSARRFW